LDQGERMEQRNSPEPRSGSALILREMCTHSCVFQFNLNVSIIATGQYTMFCSESKVK
jgi:hypothetical protein